MTAQQLTKDQALAFAEKLYQVEILSEKGRDALKERIEKDRLPAYGEVEREGGFEALRFFTEAMANEKIKINFKIVLNFILYFVYLASYYTPVKK